MGRFVAFLFPIFCTLCMPLSAHALERRFVHYMSLSKVNPHAPGGCEEAADHYLQEIRILPTQRFFLTIDQNRTPLASYRASTSGYGGPNNSLCPQNNGSSAYWGTTFRASPLAGVSPYPGEMVELRCRYGNASSPIERTFFYYWTQSILVPDGMYCAEQLD